MQNLALKKPAFQSSNFTHVHLAGNAVDGTQTSDTSTFRQNCIHTGHGDPAWWVVDLGVKSVVYKVIGDIIFTPCIIWKLSKQFLILNRMVFYKN